MTRRSEKRFVFFIVIALIGAGFLFSHLFRQKKSVYAAEEESYTVEVFFDITSVEKRLIEMEVDITYQRYGDTSTHLVLDSDEAGDRAFGTTLIAYRTAANKIPFSEITTEEGKKLLNKRAWEEIEHFNSSSYEPVRIISVNIKKMTPDPDPESVGRPTIFFLNEESGDAKAGI